ncbi:MAG: hypothetical protein ACTSYT_04495 [Candidatus Asgardarchaeia archaeon]
MLFRIKEFIKDERGSPLLEEAMIIGLSLIIIIIIATMVFDVVGWAQDALNNIFDQMGSFFEDLLKNVFGTG